MTPLVEVTAWVDPDEDWGSDVPWIEPCYSKNAVDNAGKVLRDGHPDPARVSEAIEIVDNWRSCHAYPLNTFQMALRRKAEELHHEVTVVQRLKRRPSIEAKLRTINGMKLSRMQDPGGCRAVLRSIGTMNGFATKFRSRRHYHELVKVDDLHRRSTRAEGLGIPQPPLDLSVSKLQGQGGI